MSEEKKTFTEEELNKQAEEVKQEEETQAAEGGAKVTSVAQEEAKSGEKQEITPEQARQVAFMQHHFGIQQIQANIMKLSKKAVKRVVTAWMQLPFKDGAMAHNFQSDFEKQMFAIGQNTLAAKYGILYEHVVQQAALDKKKAQAGAGAEEEAQDKETNEENKNEQE